MRNSLRDIRFRPLKRCLVPLALVLITAAEASAQGNQKCTPIALPSDNFTGKGVELTWDCARFEGDFVKGRLQKGTVTSGDGEVKQGSFDRYIELHGPGRHRLRNGTVREGSFENGTLNGEAKITFPDGRAFSGRVRFGRPNGQGRIVHPDGAYEDGFFYGEGQPFGFVLRTNPDGSRQAGEYRDGKPFGKFVLARRDGTGEVSYYDWGGVALAGPATAAGETVAATAPAAAKTTASPAGSVSSAPPMPTPTPTPTPAAQPAAAPQAAPSAAQVAEEVGRAVRGLRRLFGQ